MMILGLLLVCATGAFTGLLIADNLSGGPDYTVTILGTDIATMNSLEIFLSGLALALIFCAGLVLLLGSRRRTVRRGVRRYERRPAVAAPARGAATEPAAARDDRGMEPVETVDQPQRVPETQRMSEAQPAPETQAAPETQPAAETQAAPRIQSAPETQPVSGRRPAGQSPLRRWFGIGHG